MSKPAMSCTNNCFFSGGATALDHATLSMFDHNTQRVEQTKSSAAFNKTKKNEKG